MKGKIICGFAGIGKSTLAKEVPGVVDLESTPFEKDFDRYAKVAEHMANNGYTVLLSCHKRLREKLTEKGVDYTVVMPPVLAREEYMLRYIARGNTDEFVGMMFKNWGNFVSTIPGEKVITLQVNGHLKQLM